MLDQPVLPRLLVSRNLDDVALLRVLKEVPRRHAHHGEFPALVLVLRAVEICEDHGGADIEALAECFEAWWEAAALRAARGLSDNKPRPFLGFHDFLVETGGIEVPPIARSEGEKRETKHFVECKGDNFHLSELLELCV